VVKDFHYGGVKNEISPVMFFNYQRYWTKNQMNNLQIKLSGDNISKYRTHQKILGNRSRAWLSF
jgi:putative ABC transport system permease protein